MHLLSNVIVQTSAWQWDIMDMTSAVNFPLNLERWGQMDVMLTQVLMENRSWQKKKIDM